MSYMLTQREYAILRSRLTRAKNKGPDAVVKEVKHAVSVFNEKGWPDRWPAWRVALEDAALEFRLSALHADDDAAYDKRDATEQLAVELF